MPRKRSRSATEHRFQDAVLELIAAAGFKHLGVNSVAERAGSDKVLIYRYFEDFDGLLQRVAESRRWLPTAEELLKGPGHLPEEQLRSFFRRVSGHVTNDVATHQIALWRNAAKNPLTSKYNEEWKELWKQL
ncbi:MAG TPA: TetR/AcrR family transcriptional regulator, partial [Opitutales bacterium]|nr:TetR/AcrR family transcriptional regulator [Opitutales bacterium]